jgi:hypothetical protein
MEYLRLIGDIFEYRVRQINRMAEASSGVSRERFADVDSTYGEGMREGLVRFKSDRSAPGVFGKLHTTEVKQGRRVDRVRTITDKIEADILLGLQLEANSKR